MKEGYRFVVDLDLEKFFDRVNHDRLMAKISEKVMEKKVLLLIRKYLQSGVMENGLVKPSSEGTMQGGPLSPLLSNSSSAQALREKMEIPETLADKR